MQHGVVLICWLGQGTYWQEGDSITRLMFYNLAHCNMIFGVLPAIFLVTRKRYMRRCRIMYAPFVLRI